MIIGIDIRPLMDREPSGVGQYLFNLLDNLFKIDQKNQYQLFYNSFRDVSGRLPKWNYPNVKFCGFHYPNKLLNFSFRFLGWPKIDKLLGGCDALVIPNLCHFALSGSCRQIKIVHDISFELYKEFYRLKWRLAYWLINPGKVFRQADQLVAVSETTKNDLIKHYSIAEDKIKVVYPGVNESVSPAGNGEKLAGLPQHFILMLGTREPRKNLIGAIRAFEKIKSGNQESGIRNQEENFSLVIAGGSGWLNTEVDQAIKRSPFKQDIKVLGYVSEEVKAELYRRAEVFIYPSFYEGFGFSPLEAMQQGCPVITSLSPATAEVAGGAALLVNPYQVDEMVEGIKAIIGNRPACADRKSEIREVLIAKGRERVKEFSWEKTAREMLKIIENK